MRVRVTLKASFCVKPLPCKSMVKRTTITGDTKNGTQAQEFAHVFKRDKGQLFTLDFLHVFNRCHNSVLPVFIQ